MSIESRVLDVIVQTIGVSEDQVVRSARFLDDLGCDSLDFVELLIAAEDEFDIDISDAEAERIRTVGEAIEIVQRKVACP